MTWRNLKEETIIQNRYVTVNKNEVELPDGSLILDFYTVTIPDAAAVVAVTTDNKILLKSEYRFSQNCDLIEVPAGGFEPSETKMIEEGKNSEEVALIVAKRELKEETGYESSNWTYLGPTVESSSKLTGTMHLFLATDCQKTSSQHLDANEDIEVFEVELDEAVNMVMDGRIRCNSSAHAILMAERIIRNSIC